MGNELHLWLLSSQDYQEGLELAERHSLLKSSEKIILNTGENTFTKDRLRNIIEANVQVRRQTKVESKPQEEPKSFGISKEQRESLPDDLDALLEQIKLLYGVIDECRGELRLLNYTNKGTLRKNPSKSKNYQLAAKIMAAHEEMQSNWQRIDYYLTNGSYLPGTAPKSEREQLIDWLSGSLVRHTNYVSKYRNADPRPNEMRYQESLQVINNVKAYVAREESKSR